MWARIATPLANCSKLLQKAKNGTSFVSRTAGAVTRISRWLMMGVSSGIVKACQDAGVTDGVLNMVLGDPAMISDYLIRSLIITKVSLTGSVAVGRQLGKLAGELLKPATIELGGHAPVLVFVDADAEKAADMTAGFKYRNAGQVCLGASRIYVHEPVYLFGSDWRSNTRPK